MQLTPVGDGTLRGDVDRTTIVSVGDEVKLFDESWTLPAQGMSIGRVESIAPKESEPLRNTGRFTMADVLAFRLRRFGLWRRTMRRSSR